MVYVLGLFANLFPTVVTVLNMHMLLNSQCKDSPPPMSLMGLNQLPCLGPSLGIEPGSPALQADSLPAELPEKPQP